MYFTVCELYLKKTKKELLQRSLEKGEISSSCVDREGRVTGAGGTGDCSGEPPTFSLLVAK